MEITTTVTKSSVNLTIEITDLNDQEQRELSRVANVWYESAGWNTVGERVANKIRLALGED